MQHKQSAGRYLKKYISLHTQTHTHVIHNAAIHPTCTCTYFSWFFYFFFQFLPDRYPVCVWQTFVLCVLMKCAVLCFAHLNYHLISLSFMICCVYMRLRVCVSVYVSLHICTVLCFKKIVFIPKKMQVGTGVVTSRVVLINEMLKNVHVQFFFPGERDSTRALFLCDEG